MFDQLLNLFGQSPQGQQAYSALQAQGYSPTQSAGILTTAFPAAVTAMQNAMQSNNGQLGLLDIKNSNYAMNFLTGAVSGLAVNANALFASELGNRLAERSGSFGLVWELAAGGDVKVSLRAAGKVDVAAIAAGYGGGGHPNAAGFRMALTRFASEILGAMML